MKYIKIKKLFLNFFKKKKHKIYKSISIINKNKINNKLIFINSGINQFINFFYKKKKRKIANIQKCIRITGKNNDLNIIGFDNFHHTMFEMMGNWSFNSYSLKKAIKLAWYLLTKIYKISSKKIYVTIYKGDKNKNIKKDKTSYKIWNKFLNKNHIFFGKKNNFWQINNLNLCGPSTEIFIFLKKKNNYNKKINYKLINNNKFFIELWNIVNIKYIIKNNIIYKNKFLTNKYIDTGMGLERLCMILQNKFSTYDTDIFKPIIKIIENVLSIKYGKKKKYDIVIKIIADHIRTIYYSFIEGIKPNNKKIGYIIRKLIRRCLIYNLKIINKKKIFLYKIIKLIFKFYKYKKKKNIINFIKILKNEEIFFFKNLKKNYFLIKKNIKFKKKINKKDIYYYYNTYGIYYFLIKKIAIKYKIKIINFIKINKNKLEI